jgi:cilia- and flagella-associated protein 57
MRIFDKTGDSSWYRCGGNKEYKIEKNDSAIVRMAVAPSEENLICSTANHQSYIFALGSTEILKSGDPGVKFFEYLTGSAVHGPGPTKSAAINGMDVCVWKPLLITCGSDHTVRIWNYKERTVELTKQFSDEPLSVALHPSGLFAIVGFVDKVRVVSLLMEDMQKVKDIPVKGCRVCCFSKGGHMFAIANQSVVQLFDTYTCGVNAQLRGHNQAVRSISWADRDRRIVTVGKDGNVFLWDVRSGSRLHESMQARSTFNTATLAGDASASTSRVFAYASDMTIRSFVASTMAPEIQVQSTVPISCMVANMNGRALFLGTSTPGQPSVVTSLILKDARFPGRTAAQLAAAAAQAAAAAASEAGPDGARVDSKAILNLPTEKGAFPPASPMTQLDSQSCVAHSSAMTCIRLSVDGNTLFTGGEDGSICMFEVRDVDARGTIRLQNTGKDGNKGDSGSMGSVEEVLVTKNELVSKKRDTNKLLQKVEELKKSNDHQLRQKEMLYDERIKDVTDKFQAELDACKSKYATLVSERDKVEADFEQKLESLRGANKEELEERDKLYSVKIETERERKEALHAERKRQTAEWEATNRTIEKEQQEELKALEAIYEVKAKQEQEEQQGLHHQKDLLMKSWENERMKIENDSDLEVEEIKMKYEERLKAEQDTTVHLKGEHVVMKQKYQIHVKEVKEQEDKIKALAVHEHQLRDVYKGLEKDIQAHKNEVT